MSAQFDDVPDEVRKEVQKFTDVNICLAQEGADRREDSEP